MKNFRVEAKLHIAAFAQAETEEAAISEVVDLLDWPGGLLDEEYSAEECSCSDVLDWLNKNNRFCFGDITVVHGRWLPCGFGKEVMCSVCGCELGDAWEYRHRPDCGAKMDLKEV